jgi:hypothetical protein
VSAVARSDSQHGEAHGDAVSVAARSDCGKPAGSQHPVAGSDDSAAVSEHTDVTNQTSPTTAGGTGVADVHSDGHSDIGTDRANQASGGHSSAGSGNADAHRR